MLQCRPMYSVSIQGQAGSFHDAAAQKFFDKSNYSLVDCGSFSEVFSKVKSKEVDYGIAAVENSLFGSIHETYDQLMRSDLVIIGEIALEIHQQLVTQPSANMSDITKVYSHPAALDQCRNFLGDQLPQAELIEHQDTAGAVEFIANVADKTVAAIASEAAAKLHDMQIIARNIEDEPGNITRFIVIATKASPIKKANKASMILTTPHQPGALYQALGVFAKNEANLTKLESRPVRGRPFQYQFIVDVMASQDKLISLTHELEQMNCSTRLLGHYLSAKN